MAKPLIICHRVCFARKRWYETVLYKTRIFGIVDLTALSKMSIAWPLKALKVRKRFQCKTFNNFEVVAVYENKTIRIRINCVARDLFLFFFLSFSRFCSFIVSSIEKGSGEVSRKLVICPSNYLASVGDRSSHLWSLIDVLDYPL